MTKLRVCACLFEPLLPKSTKILCAVWPTFQCRSKPALKCWPPRLHLIAGQAKFIKKYVIWAGLCCQIFNEPFQAERNFPHLLFGLVHFHIKDWWVVFFLFIQILIEHSVSKQCRPWWDATFYGVWTGSALFVYVASIKWVNVLFIIRSMVE